MPPALRLPLEANQPLGIFGQADAVLVRERANAAWIDPRDGRIVDVLKGEGLSLPQRISEMADPLHFGTWGGMTTKIIWFVFGAAMSALAVTGVMICGVMICSLRLKNEYPVRGRASVARGAMHLPGLVQHGLVGLPSAGFVLLSLAMLPGWLMRPSALSPYASAHQVRMPL